MITNNEDAWKLLLGMVGRHIEVYVQNSVKTGGVHILRGPIRIVRIEKDRVILKPVWLKERPANGPCWYATNKRSFVITRRFPPRTEGDEIYLVSNEGEIAILPETQTISSDDLLARRETV